MHQALTALGDDDQRRLGVIADWKHGPHQLTYRQTERTFGLVADALGKDEPDGLPSGPLQRVCDDLLEASIPEEFKNGSRSLAVDWTDLESFSRPPPRGTSDCADPEAWWGHRKNNLLRSQDELFYGYYLSAGIMMRDEDGPALPELARRATVSSCRHNPVRAFAPVLTAMPGQPGSRSATSWTIPATPTATPAPGPSRSGPPGRSSSRTSTPTTAARRAPTTARSSATATCTAPRHRGRCWNSGRSPAPPPKSRPRTGTARPASWPGTSSAASPPTTADGYHRVQCPAAMGKIRCPLRPSSMTLDRDRPEILTPPEHPQACCAQQTITVPPGVLAKTAQKHDYPSAAWRRSYARRTGAERGFATAKDPASNDISRGWCRLMGLAPLTLFTTALLVTRNQRILHAWNARQEETQRRAAAGLPPRTRRRRARPSQSSPPRRHNPAPHPAARRNTHGTRPKAPAAAMPACPRTSRADHGKSPPRRVTPAARGCSPATPARTPDCQT